MDAKLAAIFVTVSFGVCGQPKLFWYRYTNHCLSLTAYPTSYAVLMRRILTEFCFKVPLNTSNRMVAPNSKTQSACYCFVLAL